MHDYFVKVCGKCYNTSKKSSKFVQYVFASQSHATKKNAHVTKGKLCFCPIKNLRWDQLQGFYLVCKRGCPKLRHTMGCLVKSIPSSWMLKQHFYRRVLKVLPNNTYVAIWNPIFDVFSDSYCNVFNRSNIKFNIQINETMLYLYLNLYHVNSLSLYHIVPS